MKTIEERVFARVTKTEGCWLWTGGKMSNGYGYLQVNKERRYAHRMVYMLLVGPIPPGTHLDHVCHVLLCVNPAHLRVISPKQNSENRLGANINNRSSGIRGVTWDKSRGKWTTQVKHNRRGYHGGRFDDLADAERAVIALRQALFTHSDMDLSA